MEVSREIAREITSFVEVAENHIARLSKAMCKTERLVRRIVGAIPMATFVTTES
jgi:hypothetical protein